MSPITLQTQRRVLHMDNTAKSPSGELALASRNLREANIALHVAVTKPGALTDAERVELEKLREHLKSCEAEYKRAQKDAAGR
jgi:hypothetical protein